MPTSTSRFMNGSSGSAYQSAARRCSPLSSSSSPSSSPFSSASSVSSSSSNSAATTAKLSALDSVFYQPKRWQSWYVKKLTCDLSIERHRASRAQQSKTVSAVAVQSRDYSYRYSNNYSSPSRQSSAYSTSTSSSSTRPQAASTMIKARHQFSTIRTSYSDVQKSFVSDVNPLRAMLVQVDFEVFGDVSGVFFTKYAKSMCENLNIKGWIRVSPKGTVYGQLQGEKEKVDEMALWLRLQGSPNSKITACEFKNWQIIDSCDFRNFNIRY